VVDFRYPPEIQAFQQEVRQFIKENWDPDIMDPRREGMAQLVDTPKRRAFMKKLGERGWLGMSWPEEYGGSGMSGLYEYVLNEELAAVGAPYIGKGVGIVGKTLIRHGSEKLKQEFLPKILNNDVEFAIGYTEPDAGSDLAALSMRAVRDDENGGWRITGQKRFTTSAHFAEWYWLAARTDADGPKHKGVTLFLLPMEQEGIQITNMPTIGDERVNEVYLDDVFVPTTTWSARSARASCTSPRHWTSNASRCSPCPPTSSATNASATGSAPPNAMAARCARTRWCACRSPTWPPASRLPRP
jgi:3-oxocholest-4-en-26-oyl-CoA dehydrogenase alpha subunit